MYRPPDPRFWSGIIDPEDGLYPGRWYKYIKLSSPAEIPPTSKGIAFLGSETSIPHAPDAFRFSMSSLFLNIDPKADLYDVGSIIGDPELDTNLLEEISDALEQLIKKGFFVVTTGGDGETAFGHYESLSRIYYRTEIGVISVGARLQNQKAGPGIAAGVISQMYESSKKSGRNFRWQPIGTQRGCNSHDLVRRTSQWESEICFTDDLRSGIVNPVKSIKRFAKHTDHLHLSLNLDVLDRGQAPGTIERSSGGLFIHELQPILHAVASTGKLASVDLAGLNPDRDVGGRTADAAASIVWHILGVLFRD